MPAKKASGPLPKPAEILHVDCRSKAQQQAKPDPSKPIRLLQWNIERGYKLEAIIEELRLLDADVLALQVEIAWLHGCVDVLALQTSMHEFSRLHGRMSV